MSIGEVLGHLRVEFPDVSISKLRFLEAEGLVEPRRTPSGYRKYTWAEVHRLRYVLSAQRDHYLPLRVIREQLAAMDRGEAPAGAPSPRPPLVAVPAEEIAPVSPAPETPPRVRRAELLERTGVGEDVLTDLERHGIVAADGGWYSADAIDVVTVAGALAEFGVTARHLRAYRTAADREVGLFAQLVAPLARSSNSATRARAAENVRELSALTQRLHAALVRIGLSDTLGR
ncbi:transcriptional regulator FtsR [Virgisporangium aliadipatigenens]|nr:MerR family transcriptional regulator [Virgisporangium aliadipatigenens]